MTAAAVLGPPTPLDRLPGWDDFDASSCFASFRALARAERPLRAAVAAGPALIAAFGRAADQPDACGPRESRAFFVDRFAAHRISPTEDPAGFLTGYYEPVVDASRERTSGFTAPVMPRPADLGVVPSRDRAAIEADALRPDATPIAWLRDWTELFLVQVQGSARLRFADGPEMRLVYDGRNGHPYTSIGRLLIDEGHISPAAMSLDILKAWLRRHGQEDGGEARRLMQRNRSYIFFRLAPGAPDAGPIGGAGVPLAAGVSIATDRTIWAYGLPFWIETETAVPGFAGPLARLFIGQDTGSAIVGAARADLFLGSGAEAGRHAGAIRHPARFTVLLPRDP